VGDTARRLIGGATVAGVVAALSRSLYLEVAGEIVWLGPRGSALHARAILADDLPDAGGAARVEVSFDLGAARTWRPPSPSPMDPTTLARESRRLVGALDRLGRPDGFGALLVCRRPAVPRDCTAAPALA